jgi:NADP-dependent 3-hydroxy acid dehydrogenase YdfG
MRNMIRQNILITGASSGLGKGMAIEFAKMGRNLALCARRVENLEALKQELLGINPDIKVFIRSLDVDNHDQVFEVIKAFAEDLGSLDRIIINAGIGKGPKPTLFLLWPNAKRQWKCYANKTRGIWSPFHP